MIEALISSKTRIKILLKFFLNSNNISYLRGLEQEFGESTNGIRVELNRLEDAGMLISTQEGNKKIFRANTDHPLYSEIHSIVRKYVGLDSIVENVVERLGDVRYVYLAGDFARGLDCDLVDLIFVGTIDQGYLLRLIARTEELIKRRVRYIIYPDIKEFEESWINRKPQPFLIWSQSKYLNEEGL